MRMRDILTMYQARPELGEAKRRKALEVGFYVLCKRTAFHQPLSSLNHVCASQFISPQDPSACLLSMLTSFFFCW